MPPKKDKKKVVKQKQKQTQRQNVIVNITAPVDPKKRRPRRKRDVETNEKSHQQSQPQMLYQRPHTFFTAPPMPPISKAVDIRHDLPLSFFDTNRPMNMGFNFNRPVVEPIATQTEVDLIPTLENQTDDNLDVVNNIGEEFGTDDASMRTPLETPSRRGRPRGQDVNIQELKQLARNTLDELGIRYAKRDSLAKLQQKIRDAMLEQMPFKKEL